MRLPELGYWLPDAVDHTKPRPEPGDIVAGNDFKPWRVIDVTDGVPHRDNPEVDYIVYRLRPVGADDNKRDIHRGWVYGGPHYGLCVDCCELTPCRALMAARVAQRSAARMARYETPGVCPHCQEIVTHRQERETFPNVVVPGGAPVTFHAGRRGCRSAMEKYRDQMGQQETQLRIDGGQGF